MFLKNKHTQPLYARMDQLKCAFENNYKDNAHAAYKDVNEMFAQLQASGKLSKKEETKIQKMIDEYSQKLEGYTHYNHIGW